jgi:hypothetical protein
VGTAMKKGLKAQEELQISISRKSTQGKQSEYDVQV